MDSNGLVWTHTDSLHYGEGSPSKGSDIQKVILKSANDRNALIYPELENYVAGQGGAHGALIVLNRSKISKYFRKCKNLKVTKTCHNQIRIYLVVSTNLPYYFSIDLHTFSITSELEASKFNSQKSKGPSENSVCSKPCTLGTNIN